MEGLEGLPDRVASLEPQVVRLRNEMHAEFLALRTEVVAATRRRGSKCASGRDDAA